MSRLRLAICGSGRCWSPLLRHAGADYYKVLTLDKGADEASIKRAYIKSHTLSGDECRALGSLLGLRQLTVVQVVVGGE